MKRMVTKDYIYVQILLFITQGTLIEKLNSVTLLCVDQWCESSLTVHSMHFVFI